MELQKNKNSITVWEKEMFFWDFYEENEIISVFLYTSLVIISYIFK